MEGNPRFPESQRVPPFPYAGYAELLGLGSARVTDSNQISEAWRDAFAANRPFLIEAIVDPATPVLPPKLPHSKEKSIISVLEREPDGSQTAEWVTEQQVIR
jgi:pyruvate dehydrogenase (quinone)